MQAITWNPFSNLLRASVLFAFLSGSPTMAQTPGGVDVAEDVVAEAIQLRHQIHENPELGNREFETAELVAEHLRSLDFDEIRTGVAYTGVVGILRGGVPGPVVAVRADMDALPVTERTDFSFRSTKRTTYLGQEVGVAHACGHDIHVAVQLGVASTLARMRDEIPGTVVFIFQPAEEGAPPGEEGGAALMMEEGVLEDPRPSAIFGLHSSPGLEVGQLSYAVGPALAAIDHFRIDVHGRQAHGARPEESIDPIVMASEIVTAFQTIRSRNLPPLEPSVVTVGMFHGGERFNIIPESVHLEGTVRTYDPEIQDEIERRMTEILEGITLAYGGSFDLEYERTYPVTINDEELAEKTVPSLERVAGEDDVALMDPVMGGEDFSVFANEIPGFFYYLGTTAPGTESGGLHTPTYRGDDSAVGVGIRVMSTVLLDYLRREQAG